MSGLASTSSLSEDKRDALQELVNVGMGSAGAALAKLLDDFVDLTVPRIVPVAPADLPALIESGPWKARDLVAVRQPFFGDVMGEAVILFDGLGYEELGHRLGYGPALSAASQNEIALDLANVVIGACVNAIAEPLSETVSFSRPALLGALSEVTKMIPRALDTWQQALIITVDFRMRSCRFESWVLMLLSQDSLVRIDSALGRFLDSLTVG